MLNNFNELYNIVKFVLGLDVTFINEYNYSGSRKSGKTYSIAEIYALTIIASLKSGKKVALYAFRKFNKDIGELNAEIYKALDKANLVPFLKVTRPYGHYIYTFSNGSFIQVRGIYTQSTNIVTLKGLSSCNGYKLAVRWLEERNEINNNEKQAVDFAIRGSDRFIKISSTNPDVIYNEYIQYCDKRLPFNDYLMTNKFEQKRYIKENGLVKFFHYQMWKINIDNLSEDELAEFEEVRVNRPDLARAWYYGLPGALQGAIFAHHIDKVETVQNFKISEIIGGLDIGLADSPTGHPTALELVGFSNNSMQDVSIGEYFHSNAESNYLNSIDLTNEILKYLVDFCNKYPLTYQGFTIYCDYAGGGLPIIDRLNSEKGKYDLDFIYFEKINKEVMYLKDRIDYTHFCMLKKWSTFNWLSCPKLREQLILIKYQDISDVNKGNNKPKMVDLNDDTWDAWCYAHMTKMQLRMNQRTVNKSVFLSKDSKFISNIDGVDNYWNYGKQK